MIKGNATIEITQETVVEALQAYFKREFVEGACPDVRSVKAKGMTEYTDPPDFVVALEGSSEP